MPDTLEPAAGGSYPPDMESRVAVLEQIARSMLAGQDRIEHRFDTLDGRFSGLEGRFNGLEGRFSTLDRRFDALSAEHRSDFRWLVGIMLGGFGIMLGAFSAMLGVMAHGFHWL